MRTPKKATITTTCSWCHEETFNIGWNCAKCGEDLRLSPDDRVDSIDTALHQRVMQNKAEAAVKDLETWEGPPA